MANRYCIASGDFHDTAIWSATSRGSGGASVPVTGDSAFFESSVELTNFSYTGESFNTTVANKVVVKIVPSLPNALLTFKGANRLEVDGTLEYGREDYPNAYVWITNTAECLIHENAKFKVVSYISVEIDGSFRNFGTVETARLVVVTRNDRCDIPFLPGRVTQVWMQGLSQTPQIVRISENVRCDLLRYSTRSTASVGFDVRLSSDLVDTGDLVFYWHTPMTITVEQWGKLRVAGNVTTSGVASGTVHWTTVTTEPLEFVGTADQTINMPSSVVGQSWIVDKPAGLLELTSFNGFLQGRLRRLVVRAASSIELAGASPVLATTSGSWSCYDGLKADVVSSGVSSTVAEHLQEAMDSCDNYGLIAIPDGKTLCTKTLKNHAGARITGAGTLCVRYGGLTNSGVIDSNVNVRYFDRPVLAVLSTASGVTAGTELSVDLAGSIGTWFRLDWGDGSFSETTTPQILKHGYFETDDTVLRTLRLTAGNDEGKTDIATKTIPVFPIPDAPEGPATPGTVELDGRKKSSGVPRGDLPSCYRFTLALGRNFMYDTLQLFCPMSESGRALANGSGLYLGRVTFSDGRLPDPLDIASASYTVYRLDGTDGTVRTPIEGHTEVPLDLAGNLLPEAVVDENWTFDALGYNFRHTPDDSMFSPFPQAGRDYLVVYTLRLFDRSPKIVFQYRVHVI